MKLWMVVLTFLIFSLVAPGIINSSEMSEELTPDEIADFYSNSVVKIERVQIGDRQEWSGSGVFYTKTRIITNAHIIGLLPKDPEAFQILYSDADIARAQFWIVFKGKKYRARFIGRDPEVDLAILEVEHEIKGTIPAPLGNSDETKVGEEVFVFGNPFGLENTVTSGIISAKQKKHGLLNYEDYIQTDAPINPGNSGGPIVSIKTGKIIGIVNSGIALADGMGFAIPINLFRDIEAELQGTVRRSWIGINFPSELKDAEGFGGLLIIYNLTGINEILALETIREEIFKNGGVLVTDVVRSIEEDTNAHSRMTPKSKSEQGQSAESKPPAYEANIEISDIIKKFGNYEVKNSRDLIYAIFRSKPNQQTTIDLVRFKNTGERINLKLDITPIIRIPESVRLGSY